MKRRVLGALLVVGLVSFGLFPGGPATARQAPEVPSDEDANIIDPQGDANFINPQGFGALEGVVPRNVVLPASPSTVGDLLKVWFTHDADNISAHIQTFRPGPATTAIGYDVFASPGEGPVAANTLGCLRFFAAIPGSAPGGGNFQSEPLIKLLDRCNEGANAYTNGVEGEFEWTEGPDGTGILTLTFPRSYSPLLEDGQALTVPKSRSALICCGDSPAARSAIQLVFMDDTDPEIGKDYEIAAPEPAKKERPKKKAKKDPPGQSVRQCNRIKNKKKRQACKRKAQQGAKGCSAYVPGEMGAEVEEETTIVTDAATEEEPIEMEFDFGPAGGNIGVDTTDHVFHNVQIDSKAKEVGFWAKLETPPLEDPDLYVYWDTGNEAARAAGFNPLLVAGPTGNAGLDGTGHGGHSGFDYEQIDGIGTADCTGYTLDLLNWLGRGGTYTLTLWLGDIENEAKPREG